MSRVPAGTVADLEADSLPDRVNFFQAPLKSTLDIATSELDPPFAVIDLDAFDHNASDLVRRASGVPLRLASKSLRVRVLQERALAAGFIGTLCFTLPEALWLAKNGSDDLVSPIPRWTGKHCVSWLEARLAT